MICMIGGQTTFYNTGNKDERQKGQKSGLRVLVTSFVELQASLL